MIPRAAFILFLCSAIPALADDPTAYMITGPVSGADQFGTIDLSTGAFTSLGNTDANGNPADPVALVGLGEVGNTLYGADVSGNLYSVNSSDGALTSIGQENAIAIVDFGSTLTTLYGLSSTGSLYTVSPTDGSVTLVGSTTIGAGGTSSLSTGSSVLYYNQYVTGPGYSLYTLNQGSGAATLVGDTNQIGALMWDGVSTLYGGTDTPATIQVETLNTTNGTVTNGAGLTGTTSDFGGLAPIITATTPEPTSVILLSTMLLAVAFVVRKRIAQGL